MYVLWGVLSFLMNHLLPVDSSPVGTPDKKQKVAAYKIEAEQKKRISQDKVNKKLWEEAKEHTSEGGQVTTD